MHLSQQVQNEGFCIIRLCKSLSDFVRFGRFRKTYLNETDDFIVFIGKVLDAVDSSVRDAITNPIAPPLIKSKQREFQQIRKALSWLYVFTKEAIDADTLSTPYSLTIFLNHIANQLKKPKVSLVVLGSSDLMYYKYNLLDLRQLTLYLNSVIPDCPKLTDNIGILKFPYCAASEILTNCILFHEMGHYFYENSGLYSQINSFIAKEFECFFNDNNQKDILIKSTVFPLSGKKWLSNYVSKLLLNWSDETFADIFATRVVGPSFHLAFLELEQILDTDISRNRKFSSSHPADDYRFKLQASWLKQGKWGDIIKDRMPLAFDKLEECNKLAIKNFSINCKAPLKDNDLEQKLHRWMLEVFEKIVVKVEDDISELFKVIDNPVDDFFRYDELITSYLKHGVVPSTFYDNDGKEKYPNPITILNSGFFFYTTKMGDLLKIVKNSDSDINNKIHFGKRLNEWLAKALEDWQITQELNKT